MRKVIYTSMLSLDGFIEGPNRELDWPIIDEELHSFINEDQTRTVDAFLYGRRMYELMTEYWPTADADPANPDYVVEFAWLWKKTPKIVFSKTLDQVEWNSRLVKGDTIEEVTKLKMQPGKNLSMGGADLAATFIRHGLIDEYHLYIHPVVLGRGTPAFPALDDPIQLQLFETRRFASGVMLLRYRRDSEKSR